VDPGMHPEHHKIVQQIGAFADHRFGLAVHGVDHHFDRFFGEFFGHFGAAGAQQPGRPRLRRV
jgi:hypothetical protein